MPPKETQEESRYHRIFEASGVSLWEEDFSEVKKSLDELKVQGIKDIDTYLAEHPEFVTEMINKVKILDVNQESLRLYEADSKEQLLENLGDIFLPETIPVFAKELAAIFNNAKEIRAECKEKTLKGKTFDILITIIFPENEKKYDKVLVSLMDISNRKSIEEQLSASQEKYQDLYDNAPDMFISVSGDSNKIIECNNTLLKTTGFDKKDIIGKSISDLYHPDSAKQTQAVFKTFNETGEIENSELLVRCKDGSKIAVSLNMSAVYDENKKVIYSRSVLRNITQLKSAEEQLQQHQLQLRRYDRLNLMAEMASGLAHELNQPFASINNFANGCIRRLESDNLKQEDLSKALNEISKQATRAGEIIQWMRDFINKGGMYTEEIDINKTITALANIVSEEATRKQTHVKIVTQKEPLIVKANKVQIEQLIMNIIINAFDALMQYESMHRNILIETTHEDKFCKINIYNSGPAIDENIIEKIFSPFFTTKMDGMGMGLSICRRILEHYSGQLMVENHGASGVTFTILLPLFN